MFVPVPSSSRRKTKRLQVGLDRFLDLAGVSAKDLVDLLTVLEEHEGRHLAHHYLFRHVGDLVDIDLDKDGVGQRSEKARNFRAITLQGPHQIVKSTTTCDDETAEYER